LVLQLLTNGYKVKAENVNGYIKYSFEIYKDPQLGERLGRNGYRKAQTYIAEVVKKELKDIYINR